MRASEVPDLLISPIMRMRPSARPYAAAALAVAFTVLLRGLLESLVGASPPLLVYLPAVTLGAWLGGLGPGLLAAALSSAVCALAPPPWCGPFSLENTRDRVRLVVFLAEGLLLSGSMEMLHAARRRSEASEREARRYQEELARSEARLRAILDNSPSAVFLKDPDGRYLLANRRVEILCGLPGGRIVGKSDADLFPPESAEQFRSGDRAVLERGEAIEGEEALELADGPHTYLTVKFPLRDADGSIYAVGGIATDITERKAADEALRRERDFAEGLIDTARAMVLVLDGVGRVVRVNPYVEHVTGRRPDEVRGRDWFDALVPPGDRRRAREATLRALAGEAGEPLVYPVLDVDGRRRFVEWANRALDAPGGGACVLAIGRDITALEEARERALQAERLAAIGEMVTGLSHESRNALHRSQVCLEMLAFEVEDRPEATQLIDRLQAAHDDLYHVFEDVRTYAGSIVLEPRPCDLAEVWRDAWAQLGASRPARTDELHEELDGVDPTCAADPFRLGQVFRNILDNALSAGPGPARVEIACSPAELSGVPAIRVAVRDNGPGLGPEARRRIFEPFFTTKTRGTGLGMAITRRIVEAHGGRIAVGDGGPGAEIIVTLPRGLP